jgi:hypothetical protein
MPGLGAALAVGLLLCLLMGYVVLVLVAGMADNYATPVMVVCCVLCLVLSVGLMPVKTKAHDQDEPPHGHL